MMKKIKIKKIKIKKIIPVLLMLLIIMSACTNPIIDQGKTTPAPEVEETVKSPMLALTDLAGNSVTVPSAPKKIISLSPAVTEILFALNYGEYVIGVDELSDYPEQVTDITKYSKTDMKAIIAAEPDLVLYSRDLSDANIDELKAANISIACIEATNYTDVFSSISFVSWFEGNSQSTLVKDMNAIASEVFLLDFDFEPMNVLVITSESGSDYKVAGNGSIANELITMLGSSPVTVNETAAETVYTKAMIEEIDPQVIIVYSSLGVDKIESAMPELNAVNSGRVFEIEGGFFRAGPRMVEGLLALHEAFEQAAQS